MKDRHPHSARNQEDMRGCPSSVLFFLADNGGSNGSTHHAWKHALQHQLADPFGITVTVCHYPSASSKWNPIEHRLFAQISQNWAGEPLTSYETIINIHPHDNHRDWPGSHRVDGIPGEMRDSLSGR